MPVVAHILSGRPVVVRPTLGAMGRSGLARYERAGACLSTAERLMTTPDVGPAVALTYRATVDVPAPFRKSKSVGAIFGLTCSRYQSGEIDWRGKISRCGDR